MIAAHGARTVRAPRGTQRTAKSWLTEAPLRMLMNNLDPRGRGESRRAGRLRRHRPRRAQLGMLRSHRRVAARAQCGRNAADPVRQAGRRVSHARRCAARAARQFEPRAEVVDVGALQRARPPRPDDVRPDDRWLVDLHRQPGHRARHARDVRRNGAAPFRRRSQGQVDSRPRASAAWAARSRSRRRWRARACCASNASRAAFRSGSTRATSTRRRRRSMRR